MEINEEALQLNSNHSHTPSINTTITNNNNNNHLTTNTRPFSFSIPFLLSFISIIIPLTLITSNFHPLSFYPSTNRINNEHQIQTNIRKLNDINILNETSSSIDLSQELPNKQSLIDLYSTKYEFISNITAMNYIGKYSNLKMQHDLFKNDFGEVELNFYKTSTNPNIEELLQSNALKAQFILKDEHYIDKYVKANFTINFPEEFITSYKNSLIDQNEFEISMTNTTIDYYACEFLLNSTKYQANQSSIQIIFYNKQRLYTQRYDSMIVSKYSSIGIHIKSENFSVDFTTDVEIDTSLQYQIRNYSFFLTIICIIEMYYISVMLAKVTSNSEVGLNLDLITIGTSLIYKGMICTSHFYLAIISSNGMSYEYGIPSMLYFFGFSLFEFRLLFFSWRTRYNELLFSNRNQFKYKLLLFYLCYYIALFVSLVFMRSIITNTICCFVIFTLTWLGQIVHSVRMGTKPPMNVDYILVNTITRLFLPIYLKAYEGNIFSLRPSYGKVFAIIVIVFIEVCILILQKSYGGKVIIPRCCKTIPFNYYRDEVNCEEHISKNQDCVICLESLKEEIKIEVGKEIQNDIIEEDNNNNDNNNKHTFVERIKKIYCIGFCIKRINDIFNPMNTRKKYMVTPCDHVFHSNCLEKWMEVKNECPYCKRRIPPIE